MIVTPKDSQIDVTTYAPLVMVKNGVFTHLFSDGLVDLSKVKKLQLPNARCDYIMKAYRFTVDNNGVRTSNNWNFFFVDKKQTTLEFNIDQTALVYLEAQLITTEV